MENSLFFRCTENDVMSSEREKKIGFRSSFLRCRFGLNSIDFLPHCLFVSCCQTQHINGSVYFKVGQKKRNHPPKKE